MGLGNEAKRKLGRGETDVRVERGVQHHQAKSQASPELCVSSFAFRALKVEMLFFEVC